MIKKKTTGVFFALIFLLGLFFLVNINSQQINASNQSRCTLENGYCEVQHNQQSIALQITPENIPLEEELSLQFDLPEHITIVQGWVSGINMYMGKTPVIFESDNVDKTRAITFLGSCSEPDMQWQLVLTVKDQATGGNHDLYFRFSTHRN